MVQEVDAILEEVKRELKNQAPDSPQSIFCQWRAQVERQR